MRAFFSIGAKNSALMLVLKCIFTCSKGKKTQESKMFSGVLKFWKNWRLQEAGISGDYSRVHYKIICHLPCLLSLKRFGTDMVLTKFIKRFGMKLYKVEIQNHFFRRSLWKLYWKMSFGIPNMKTCDKGEGINSII